MRHRAIKRFFAASIYLTVVPRIIQWLWFVSIPNTGGWALKKWARTEWLWLPELYQGVVVAVMLCGLFHPPLRSALVAFAGFRPCEIFVFILHWIFTDEPVQNVRRSLIGFVINQVEVILCFAVIFTKSQCAVKGPVNALYNSLRTAVTIGPADPTMDKCPGLLSAEIVVAYLITVVVIAAVVGKVARGERVPA